MKSLHRLRNRALGLPKIQSELFLIPKNLTLTPDGHNFVVFHYGTDERIIGYESNLDIQTLSRTNTLFGDDAFVVNYFNSYMHYTWI